MNSNQIGVIIFALVQIPSFLCAAHFLLRAQQKNSPLRRLPNHLLICLVLVSLWSLVVDLPMAQVYLWTGSFPIRTEWACIAENVSFFSMAGFNLSLMAFMSIERHFLVFCPRLYRTRRSRVCFHYLPVATIVVTIFLYFLLVDTIATCPRMNFDYNSHLCGYTCAIVSDTFGSIYIWLHVFLPTTITIVACILLPIRFLLQKRTLQRLQWHRARKMIVQMSVIAGAYILCWLPFAIVLQLLLRGRISFRSTVVRQYISYAPYVVILLTPFVVQHTMPGYLRPEMVQRVKHRFFPKCQNTVQPPVTLMVQPRKSRTCQ